MDYVDFLRKHGYSKEIVRLAEGGIDVPKYTFKAPADPVFGFPPVLIPLWSNSAWPGYIGISKHWFGPAHESFVQFFVEDLSFVEIARSFQQLKAWMVYDFLCNVPDFDEVGKFANSIGFCAPEEVAAIFEGVSDVQDLTKLSVFGLDMPAILKHPDRHGTPEWVVEAPRLNDTQVLIDKGFYEEAWYQLNSALVERSEILKLLDVLRPRAKEECAFRDLIICWTESNAGAGSGHQ